MNDKLIRELQKVTEDVYTKAHNNALYIWWYNIASEQLECFSRAEVDLHTSEKFTLNRSTNPGRLIKGRIYEDEGKPMLMIYYELAGSLINQQVLQKLVSKLQVETGLDFSGIYDESGKEIIMEKKT